MLLTSSIITSHLNYSRGSQPLSCYLLIKSILHLIVKLIFQNKNLTANCIKSGSGSPLLLRNRSSTSQGLSDLSWSGSCSFPFFISHHFSSSILCLTTAELYLFQVCYALSPPCLPTHFITHPFHSYSPICPRFITCFLFYSFSLLNKISRAGIIIYSLISNTVFLLNRYFLTRTEVYL